MPPIFPPSHPFHPTISLPIPSSHPLGHMGGGSWKWKFSLDALWRRWFEGGFPENFLKNSSTTINLQPFCREHYFPDFSGKTYWKFWKIFQNFQKSFSGNSLENPPPRPPPPDWTSPPIPSSKTENGREEWGRKRLDGRGWKGRQGRQGRRKHKTSYRGGGTEKQIKHKRYPEGPARHLDVSRQKVSPHCLETIFDSQLPSPKLSPKMRPKLSLPHKRGFLPLSKLPCGEGSCETIFRLKDKYCLAAIFASRH